MFENGKDDFWNLDEYIKPKKSIERKEFSKSSTSAIEIESNAGASNTNSNINVNRDPVPNKFTDMPLSGSKDNGGTITRFIPPNSDSAFAKKYTIFEYSPENPLIRSVRIYSEKPDEKIFVESNLFIRERKALLNRAAQECARVSYFSYSPRYSQMSRAQLNWYLWWRENTRRGIFLKTDETYIILYAYELCATGEGEDKQASLEMLCNLLCEYSDKEISIVFRMMIRDLICDFCLLHGLPTPIEKLNRLDRGLLSNAFLPEFFLDFSERNREHSVKYGISSLSLYDYKRSKFYLEHSEVFKSAINGAINAIIMPWGSQNTQYIAADEFEEADFHPDQNVIDVRDNSLLNPLRATADNDCTVVESVFLPTVRSTNGRSAEFTVSGGANNCTVKIEGFTSLTTPVVYEKNDEGEWVRYNLSSHYYPDYSEMTHDYDGYMVHYEKDGFLSYSFVVKMNILGQPRSFKIVVDEDAWEPEVEPEKGAEDEIIKAELVEGYNRFFNTDSIYVNADNGSVGKIEAKEENGKTFLRFYSDPNNSDTQFYAYTSVNEVDPLPTGQFFVFKYRLDPIDIYHNVIQLFTSTKRSGTKGVSISGSGLVEDGNWHVIIINLAALIPEDFKTEKDGGYYANHLRFDIFGNSFPSDKYIDIEYMAWDDSFDEILAANSDLKNVIYYDGVYYTVPTDGGEMPAKIIIDNDTKTYDTPFKLYISPRMVAHRMINNSVGVDHRLVELVETPSETYVSLYGNTYDDKVIESFIALYDNKEGNTETGQYIVLKYKTSFSEYVQFYSGTEKTSASEPDSIYLTPSNQLITSDGEWHITIIDLSTSLNKAGAEGFGFNPADDGKFYAKYLRFDPINSSPEQAAGEPITVEFIAMTDDLASAITYDSSVPFVTFFDGDSVIQYDTTTGDIYIPSAE